MTIQLHILPCFLYLPPNSSAQYFPTSILHFLEAVQDGSMGRLNSSPLTDTPNIVTYGTIPSENQLNNSYASRDKRATLRWVGVAETQSCQKPLPRHSDL